MISTFATEARIVLGQEKAFDIVTIDVMGRQYAIANQIIKKEGDYDKTHGRIETSMWLGWKKSRISDSSKNLMRWPCKGINYLYEIKHYLTF